MIIYIEFIDGRSVIEASGRDAGGMDTGREVRTAWPVFRTGKQRIRERPVSFVGEEGVLGGLGQVESTTFLIP